MLLSSGCVCTVALVRAGTVHIANLGDCVGIVSNDGDVSQRTEEHKPEGQNAEALRLQAMGAEVSGDGYLHGRLAVSRAFGDYCWYQRAKCYGVICEPDATT